jgi:hypothetical protein
MARLRAMLAELRMARLHAMVAELRMARLRVIVATASGVLAWCAVALGAPALAQPAQPGQPQPGPPAAVTPSITVDPGQPGATPHWTITVPAEYCGGYRVGDGVYVSPEAPLAMPTALPDGTALFAGEPAAVDSVNGALRIAPGPGLVHTMICVAGPQSLNVELLPEAGFALPSDPGDYAVDVWTGADPSPISLSFTVPAAADTTEPPASDN